MTSQDIVSMPVAILVHMCIARPPLKLAKTFESSNGEVYTSYYQVTVAGLLKMHLPIGYGTLRDCSRLEAEVVVAFLRIPTVCTEMGERELESSIKRSKYQVRHKVSTVHWREGA